MRWRRRLLKRQKQRRWARQLQRMLTHAKYLASVDVQNRRTHLQRARQIEIVLGEGSLVVWHGEVMTPAQAFKTWKLGQLWNRLLGNSASLPS